MEPFARGETRLDYARLHQSTSISVPIWRHTLVRVATTRATEFIDITDRLNAFVTATEILVGFVNIQALHTTTAIVVNEHEPLLLTDFESMLDKTAPADAPYRHDETSVRTVNVTPDERINGYSHCRALLLGPSACVNIADGRLLLGRWQRVFMVELDGPRDRVVSTMVCGEPLGSVRGSSRRRHGKARRARKDGRR